MSSVGALWRAARNPPADPKDLGYSFKDKAVLVTGAYGIGLGANAAVKYAALGANPLILATRTQEKGEQAKQDIVRRTGCSQDSIIVEPLELASFESVKDFADRLNKRVPALHVVQLAGGVAPWAYTKSADNYELSLQVDVLAHTLLAILLLPKLRATAATTSSPDGYKPHISFMNSIAIFEVPDKALPSDGQTLIQRCDDEGKWDPIEQYFLIKLATWYAAKGVADLASRDRERPDVIVNATCPGLCNTDMTRDLPKMYKVFMVIRYFFLGRSPEMGSRTLVSATGLGPESHGKFWTNDKYHELGEFLESERSDKLYRETWSEIISILRPYIPEGII